MIKLVTENNAKYQFLSSALTDNKIEIVPPNKKLLEIQTLDLREAAIFKAQQAYNQFRCPVIIDEASLLLKAYENFPGTMTKYILKLIKLDGLEALLEGRDKSATLNCHLAYTDDGVEFKIFEGKIEGKLNFSKYKKHGMISPLPLSNAFIPDGQQKRLAELEGKNPQFPTHRVLAFNEFLIWNNGMGEI